MSTDDRERRERAIREFKRTAWYGATTAFLELGQSDKLESTVVRVMLAFSDQETAALRTELAKAREVLGRLVAEWTTEAAAASVRAERFAEAGRFEQAQRAGEKAATLRECAGRIAELAKGGR